MADTGLITSTNPGRAGTLFRGPVGTLLPHNAIDDLDPMLKDQGIVGEDGITQSITRDTEDIKAYGGDTVYTLQNEYGQEITLTLYESANLEVLKTIFGDDNVIDDGTTVAVRHNKARLPRSSFVIDHLTDQGTKRQVIEIGQVSEVGDIVNVHSDIVKYEVTIKTYPNADGDYMLEFYSRGGAEAFGIATGVLRPGVQKKPYSVTLQSAGGKSPVTWEVVGKVPDGLKVTEDGRLTGTPTTAGQQEVTVKATDATGKAVQKTFTLMIAQDTAQPAPGPESEPASGPEVVREEEEDAPEEDPAGGLGA